MAIIKLGSIVTDLSGSSGGSTVQNSRAGYILRNKPQQVFSRTSSQYSIRSINTAMHAGWKSLNDYQRSVWNYYAKSKPVFNQSGDKYPLSGHSLWLKYQYGRLIEQLPFLTHPDQYLNNYLGPELILNGSFDTTSNWILNAYSSIHDGKLFGAGPPTGRQFSYQTNVFLVGVNTYRVQLTSQNEVGAVYFGNGSAPWQHIYNSIFTYIFTRVALYNNFTFNFNFNTSCIFDNVSVKQIYS